MIDRYVICNRDGVILRRMQSMSEEEAEKYIKVCTIQAFIHIRLIQLHSYSFFHIISSPLESFCFFFSSLLFFPTSLPTS